MFFIKPQNLQTKFLLWLAVIMTLAGAVSVSMLRLHLRAMLEEDVRSKARLILSNVDALEGFMDQALQPAMCEVLAGERFMRESMSMSRTVMVPGEPEQEQFHYRRAGFGALSHASGASPLETDLEERFARDPSAQLEEFFSRQGGEEAFVAARPLRARAGCLRCHGGADQVPADLRERMGQWAGFDWKEGQLVGAQVVSLPLRGSLSRIHGATWGFILLFGVGGLGLYVLISVLFNRLVVHNLKRVLAVMRHYFPEEATERRSPAGHSDEIEELLNSVEDFAGSLRQARSELKSHAATLEQRVAERTAELSREAEARREDVALFMGLLNGLTRSHTRQELLNSSLELIGRRFGAQQVSYCCTLSAGASHTWPRRDLYTPLPSDWHTMVSEGQSRLVDRCAMVPVQTTEVGRGLLAVCWNENEVPPDAHSLEVLGAVGQQLGVVMENLEALGGLVRQNDLLQSVFDGISDPLMLLDDLGRVIMANSSASDLPMSGPPADPGLPGIGLDDQPGSGFLSFALGIEPGKPLPQQMLRAPQVHEIRLPGERWFMVSLYPPRHYLGRGGGLVVYVREVTAERRMLEKSQQNEKLLAVGRLASGLAHEMNNPLGVILCYAELLKGQLGESKSSEDLDIIIKHAIQAQKVLGDLLCFVRPSQVELEPCDLTEAARQVVEAYQARAASQEARLDLDADGPVTALAGASALEQVLANLVINALDAVDPQDGRVLVRCGVEGGRAYLKVRDNGPGVSAENRKRIFEPFFTTKEVGRGTGLGLAVVYGLVADMGGSVEVSEGPGAEFTVWLERAEEAAHVSY